MSNKLKSIKTTRKVILKVTRTYKTGKFAYTTKKQKGMSGNILQQKMPL